MSRSESLILHQLGLQVRSLRKRAGLSQEELAARAGLHRTYVGGVERGERNVAVINLVRLAEALAVEPARLLAWTSLSEEV